MINLLIILNVLFDFFFFFVIYLIKLNFKKIIKHGLKISNPKNLQNKISYADRLDHETYFQQKLVIFLTNHEKSNTKSCMHSQKFF